MNRASEIGGTPYTIIRNTRDGSTIRRRQKGAEKIFEEIMTKNLQNVLNKPNLHIQEAQQTPRRKNAMRYKQPHHSENAEGQITREK